MERTVLLHDLEELNDDLGGWADHNLALAGLLGVVDGIERIVEDGSLDHFGGRFSGREGVRREVSEGGCHVSGPCPSGARRVCFWEDHEKAFFSSSHRGKAVSLQGQQRSHSSWPLSKYGTHQSCRLTWRGTASC